jgi:hypothetical protein
LCHLRVSPSVQGLADWSDAILPAVVPVGSFLLGSPAGVMVT